MARARTRTLPKPGQLWLSCLPYLLVAQITGVDTHADPNVVSYELYDESGYPLEEAVAALDDGWWQAFQPLRPRHG